MMAFTGTPSMLWTGLLRRDEVHPRSGWTSSRRRSLPHRGVEDFDKVEPPGQSPGGVLHL
jgi:hypothetical protein